MISTGGRAEPSTGSGRPNEAAITEPSASRPRGLGGIGRDAGSTALVVAEFRTYPPPASKMATRRRPLSPAASESGGNEANHSR